MNSNCFKEIINKRMNIDDENYMEVEKCRKEMEKIFSDDINQTIAFLSECTADEFSWLSEVFDQITEKTHSKDFIKALYKTAKKYPEETEKYNIYDFINSAQYIAEENP